MPFAIADALKYSQMIKNRDTIDNTCFYNVNFIIIYSWCEGK